MFRPVYKFRDESQTRVYRRITNDFALMDWSVVNILRRNITGNRTMKRVGPIEFLGYISGGYNNSFRVIKHTCAVLKFG